PPAWNGGEPDPAATSRNRTEVASNELDNVHGRHSLLPAHRLLYPPGHQEGCNVSRRLHDWWAEPGNRRERRVLHGNLGECGLGARCTEPALWYGLRRRDGLVRRVVLRQRPAPDHRLQDPQTRIPRPHDARISPPAL